MGQSKSLHGARGKIYISDPTTGQYRLAGVFNNVSWGVNYSVAQVDIIGRFNTGEQVITGMDPISVELSGFRVLDNGPYEIGNCPMLQDLLTYNDFHIALVDRQTGKTFMQVEECVVNNWGSSLAAKSLVDMRIGVTGVTLSDESGPQGDPSAVDFG